MVASEPLALTSSLTGRRPAPTPARLLADLVPPPRFDAVTFDGYRPDPAHPTQTAARDLLVATVDNRPQASGRRGGGGGERGRGAGEREPDGHDGALPGGGGRGAVGRDGGRGGRGRGGGDGRGGRGLGGLLRGLGRGERGSVVGGVYLDGGFGVGKTHLLAALWHAAEGPKAYGTFVEYTNLVGALGFAATVEALAGFRLVCIDEFELDDPGDTVLMSTLLGRLADAGVRLAATSNTLPGRLGEGRFAADDFLREIQGLAARFQVVRIDGPDYRHRDAAPAPAPHGDAELTALAARVAGPGVTDDPFDAVLDHLASLHPSRYGALLDGVEAVVLRGVRPVADVNVALRLVVLVDRLYDRRIPVLASGVPVDQVFPAELRASGYRKKYLRAVSRLAALAREADVTFEAQRVA